MLNTLPPYRIKSNRLARDPASCRLAHYEGRVADENAIGGNARFAGSLGTQVLEVFDVAATRTGLRDREAIAAANYSPHSHTSIADDHGRYYPERPPPASQSHASGEGLVYLDRLYCERSVPAGAAATMAA